MLPIEHPTPGWRRWQGFPTALDSEVLEICVEQVTRIAEELCRKARRMKEAGQDWKDIFVELLGSKSAFAKLPPEIRIKITATKSFEELYKILDSDHLPNGSHPTRNSHPEQCPTKMAKKAESDSVKGRALLTIRVPRALHRALVFEAELAGMSLNQLCTSKLCMELGASVRALTFEMLCQRSPSQQ